MHLLHGKLGDILHMRVVLMVVVLLVAPCTASWSSSSVK